MTKASTKKAYHHGDLKNALVRAGTEILAQSGVEALSLRGAARKAGVSAAAPYRHFHDKDDLLAAIAEEGFVRLNEVIDECIAEYPDDPLKQLTESGVVYLRFALKHPDHFRVMLGGPIPPRNVVELGNGAFGRLREVVQECQRRGFLGRGDTGRIALSILSMIHGFAMLAITDRLRFLVPEPENADEVIRQITRILYAGLKK